MAKEFFIAISTAQAWLSFPLFVFWTRNAPSNFWHLLVLAELVGIVFVMCYKIVMEAIDYGHT